MHTTQFEVEQRFLRVELRLCSRIVAVEAAWLAWHISEETLCCYLMHDQSSSLQKWPQHRAVGRIMLLIEHAAGLRGYAGCILVLFPKQAECVLMANSKTAVVLEGFFQWALKCVCAHVYGLYIWTCACSYKVYRFCPLRILTNPEQPYPPL